MKREYQEFRENMEVGVPARMQEILSVIPETGPTPEIKEQFSKLESDIFTPELISKLKSENIDIQKVHSFLSRRKMEIILPFKILNGEERQVMVRFRTGEGGAIRITTGVYPGGEGVLKEEALPEALAETWARIFSLIEQTVGKKPKV